MLRRSPRGTGRAAPVFLARLAALAALLFAGAAGTAGAQESETRILTGGPEGTYIQFGRDIAEIASECGVSLEVEESAGSLANFLGVRSRQNTQFGIVQSDVLDYLRTYAAEDADVARAVSGMRVAFPLYDEEVHLLARREISGIEDLEGRRVAIGGQDSGTFLTAALVLDLAGVTAERVTIAPDAAFEDLLAGEIDALFYVAGAPVALFENPAIDAEAFHLVPLTDEVLRAAYRPVTISGGTYPFQDEAVATVAVKAVLMTFEYDSRGDAYQRRSCEAVARISHLIVSRFDALRQNGHPKWRQVDLGDIPSGWNVSRCVNAGLAEDYTLECRADTPAEVPPETAPESPANSAYRDRICAAVGC